MAVRTFLPSPLGIAACILFYVLNTACADVIIHGYSVLIQPPDDTALPRDAAFSTSNFYSYASPIGYLSFGWWLPAGANTNTSHCVPDPDRFDFYEFSSGPCGMEECLVHVWNYNASNPETPVFEEDYEARTVKVGEEPNASLSISYFDKKNGAYAVGSRSLVGVDGIDVGRAEECHKAFKTMQRLRKKYNPPLRFELENPCSDAIGSTKGQTVQQEL